MRTLTFVAVAAMCMWIAGDVDAQQLQGTPAENNQAPQNIEGQKLPGVKTAAKKPKRGEGRRGGAQMMEFLFKRFDKDQNGSISLAEAPQRMKRRFKQLDSNNDKSVSKAEMNAAFENNSQRKRMKDGKREDGAGKREAGRKGRALDPIKMMQVLDKNNDGVISLDEAPENMKKRFGRIDADSSSTITADELEASIEKMKQGGKHRKLGRDGSARVDAMKLVKPKRLPITDGGA